jgi:hypothetical protein
MWDVKYVLLNKKGTTAPYCSCDVKWVVTASFSVDHDATYRNERNPKLRDGSTVLRDTRSDTKSLEAFQRLTQTYQKKKLRTVRST